MSATTGRFGRIRRGLALVALASGSTAFALGLFEVGLRLAGYEPIFDVYSKPSVFWIHDDRIGWVHEPGASGTYVGPRPWPIEFRTPIRINSLGMRGPEPAPLPEDGYRILVMGDSVVAGFEVAYEDTFVAGLQRRLDAHFPFPVQVLNGGVRGYGTDQSLLFYRERARSLKPDLVVFQHSVNDLVNNVTLHRMRRPFGKPAYAPLPDGGLRLEGLPVPDYPLCTAVELGADFDPVRIDTAAGRALCWFRVQLADHSALFTWASLQLLRHPDLLNRLNRLVRLPGAQTSRLAGVAMVPTEHGPRLPESARWELTERILRAYRDQVEADGARFVLIMRPDHAARMRLQQHGIEPRDTTLRGFMAGEAAYRGIHFRNDAHLNETGHAILARKLAEIVTPLIEADRRGLPGAVRAQPASSRNR